MEGTHYRQQLNPALTCLLYTSDAADDLLCVNLGCRRIIKKKNKLVEANGIQQEDYEKQDKKGAKLSKYKITRNPAEIRER